MENHCRKCGSWSHRVAAAAAINHMLALFDGLTATLPRVHRTHHCHNCNYIVVFGVTCTLLANMQDSPKLSYSFDDRTQIIFVIQSYFVASDWLVVILLYWLVGCYKTELTFGNLIC